jgi:FtsP/CotA-like multicopper oxidase with cupredoxin domain
MKGMMMNMPESESHDGIEWEDEMVMMNKMHTSDMVEWNIVETSTGKKDMDINWSFNTGDIVKVRIRNEATGDHPMQHPIHFHGQRFLVIDENGEINDNLVWKDTVLVKK